MSGIVNRVINMAAASYQKAVSKRLAMYGLKLEDLYVEEPSVEKALSRLPPDVLQARERRIKRAFDLSAKKKTMPEELWDKKPLEEYMESHIQIAKAEEDEKKSINTY